MKIKKGKMSYADPLLNADFQSAIQDVQALEAQTVIIQNVPYDCVLGTASFQQVFEDGGPFRSEQRLPCSVLKSAFSVAPVLGNIPCTARGQTWRITDVRITAMTYELTLTSTDE